MTVHNQKCFLVNLERNRNASFVGHAGLARCNATWLDIYMLANNPKNTRNSNRQCLFRINGQMKSSEHLIGYMKVIFFKMSPQDGFPFVLWWEKERFFERFLTFLSRNKEEIRDLSFKFIKIKKRCGILNRYLLFWAWLASVFQYLAIHVPSSHE